MPKVDPRKGDMYILLTMVLMIVSAIVGYRMGVKDTNDKVIEFMMQEEEVPVVFEFQPAEGDVTLSYLFEAICIKESGNDIHVKDGDAGEVGIAQILDIYLEDVNRMCRALGRPTYTSEDRRSKAKAFEMFVLYTDWYCKHYGIEGTNEVRARMHNGGPDGHTQSCTLGYWDDVKRIIQEIK